MALVNCKKCGLPMSSYIKTCPSCGYSEQAEEQAFSADAEAAQELATVEPEAIPDLALPEHQPLPEPAPQEEAAAEAADESLPEPEAETPGVAEVQAPAEPEPEARAQMRLCPLCLENVDETQAAQICPVCSAAHHADCWEKNGGCAMPGCSAHDAIEPKPVRAPHRHEEIVLPPDDPADGFEDFLNNRRGGSGKRKPLLIAVVLILFILLVAIIGAFLLGNGKPKSQAPSPKALTVSAPRDEIDCGSYRVSIEGTRLVKTTAGNAAAVTVSFANTSTSPMSFLDECVPIVTQGGVHLDYDYSCYNSDAYGNLQNFWADNLIEPGTKIKIDLIYELYDTQTAIDVEIRDKPVSDALAASSTTAIPVGGVLKATITF